MRLEVLTSFHLLDEKKKGKFDGLLDVNIEAGLLTSVWKADGGVILPKALWMGTGVDSDKMV